LWNDNKESITKKFHRRNGCFSVVYVVCCQVVVSVMNWSLVQRSSTDCGASLCVITKPRERGGHSPRWAAVPEKITINNVFRSRNYQCRQVIPRQVWNLRFITLFRTPYQWPTDQIRSHINSVKFLTSDMCFSDMIPSTPVCSPLGIPTGNVYVFISLEHTSFFEHFLVKRNLEASVYVNLHVSYSLAPSIIPREDTISLPSFARVKIMIWLYTFLYVYWGVFALT
jgi:hypothetical protein